jgi:hypothetical protein
MPVQILAIPNPYVLCGEATLPRGITIFTPMYYPEYGDYYRKGDYF